MRKDDITRGIHMRIFAAGVHKGSVPIAMLMYKEFCDFTACTQTSCELLGIALDCGR
jgi:hypothetical protein